ncbi:MAG: efflux RND transporter periplasmic adaptor subunit [Deltaproteobacteria bacterium]|nr:efflux RND transporter periplasmic adaptor subunit [Deltaproteobacteria bacterium]
MVKNIICFTIFISLLNPYRLLADHDHHDEKEGVVHLTDLGMSTSDIKIEKAVKKKMDLSIDVNGYVVPDEYHTSQVLPRFPGIITSVFVHLGDYVKKGQRLAVIQANGSETHYNVNAAFSGSVIVKNVIQGQFVSTDQTMFTISDLSKVWIHLNIPEIYIPSVRKGQKVQIRDWNKNYKSECVLSFVSPSLYKDSQSIMVSAEIDNSNGLWRPGLFVKAKIYTGTVDDVFHIPKESIQTIEEKNVIFIEKEERTFFAQPVITGRKNEYGVEILSGLTEGDNYVSKNSYILKADYLKSEASHDH